jgi:serine/threonine protein kinase
MIEREKKVLMLLEHPNIVKLLEIIEDDEKDATYLVFEYVGGGELFNYIVSKGRLAEPVARKFARQVSQQNIAFFGWCNLGTLFNE